MAEQEKIVDIKQQKTVIKLLIYSVDDIYDDFDLRNINVRSISEDFISEVVSIAKNSYGEAPITIKLIAPRDTVSSQLTPEIQSVTRDRIKGFFYNKYNDLYGKRRKQRLEGWSYLATGLLCFLIFKYASLYETNNLFMNSLFDLISFVSWFSTWNGIITLKDKLPKDDILFYKRLAESGIYFNFK